MWNPADILDKFQEEPWVTTANINIMELKLLSMKKVMLILLAMCKRGQIIPALNLNDVIESKNSFDFRIPWTQPKEGRPDYKPKLIILPKFSDQNICIVYHLKKVHVTDASSLRKKPNSSNRYPYNSPIKDFFVEPISA